MDIVETYLKELENSTQLENIARRLNVDLETVRSFIEPFKKKAELEYPTHYKFISHFKNFVNLELSKKKTGFLDHALKVEQNKDDYFKRLDSSI